MRFFLFQFWDSWNFQFRWTLNPRNFFIRYGKIFTQLYFNFSRQEHQKDVLYVSVNVWDSQVPSYTRTPKRGMNALLAIVARFCDSMKIKLAVTKTFILTNAQGEVDWTVDDATLEEALFQADRLYKYEENHIWLCSRQTACINMKRTIYGSVPGRPPV